MPIDHLKVKLGKKAPRSDHRTLRLAKYCTEVLPEPLAAWGFLDKITDWGLLANDRLGLCVEAAQLHMVQQWTAYASTEQVPSDADAIALYGAEAGYVAGDDSTDNGTELLAALRYWKGTGVIIGDPTSTPHQIGAYMAVNPKDQKELKQAISLFGNLFMGFALPISAQNPSVGQNGKPSWVNPGSTDGTTAPGSWGGHGVCACAYNAADGLQIITWGQVYNANWDFVSVYCDEAYVCLSRDFIAPGGASPSGFNLEQLQADLALL